MAEHSEENELEEMELPVGQKLAILFVALGQEAAGEVMKNLTDYEVEEITQAITALKGATQEMQISVLEEFEESLLAGEWLAEGGIDYARGLLEQALGPGKAQEILDRLESTVTSGFQLLRNVRADQVVPFLTNEHPQTIALILAHLESSQAAAILSHLSEQLQADVAYRAAAMENVTPAVLKEIEQSLAVNLGNLIGGNQEVGGPKVVADILNLTGGTVEKNVLEHMDTTDPEVAEAVRNLMFVFADIARLTDREIQQVMAEIEKGDLVIALKAASGEVKEKLLGNLSERVRGFINEEMELSGPLRLSEVEEVQLKIVQRVRQMEEQGQISIVRGDADDTFV
jgi:flagellar motor switch protein FliG